MRARRVLLAVERDERLRQALVDAALELSRDADPGLVTVRAAARHAGLTAAVAQRQFASRAALMGAAAAEALRRFHDEMQHALAHVAGDDPVARLSAIGHAFVHWAVHNPTHFRILSARHLLSFAQLPELREELQDVADGISALVAEAQRRGQWPRESTRLVVLTCRALAYGLSRMMVDGQLPQWGVDEREAEPTLLNAFDLYFDLLAKAARQPGTG